MSGNLDEWLILGHVCGEGLTEGESSRRSGPWPGFIMTPGQITSHLHCAIDIGRALQWQRVRGGGHWGWKNGRVTFG